MSDLSVLNDARGFRYAGVSGECLGSATNMQRYMAFARFVSAWNRRAAAGPTRGPHICWGATSRTAIRTFLANNLLDSAVDATTDRDVARQRRAPTTRRARSA